MKREPLPMLDLDASTTRMTKLPRRDLVPVALLVGSLMLVGTLLCAALLRG